MKRANRKMSRIVTLGVCAAFALHDSTAHAWPVSRFYRTRSTRTVAATAQQCQPVATAVATQHNSQAARRRPTNRFYNRNIVRSPEGHQPWTALVFFRFLR